MIGLWADNELLIQKMVAGLEDKPCSRWPPESDPSRELHTRAIVVGISQPGESAWREVAYPASELRCDLVLYLEMRPAEVVRLGETPCGRIVFAPDVPGLRQALASTERYDALTELERALCAELDATGLLPAAVRLACRAGGPPSRALLTFPGVKMGEGGEDRGPRA